MIKFCFRFLNSLSFFMIFFGLSTPPSLSPNSVGDPPKDMFPFVLHLAGIPFEEGSLGFKEIIEHIP